MTEIERTLVKSPPELWELVDDEELMARWASELGGGAPEIRIEVSERDHGRKLAWRSVSPAGTLAVDLEIAEKGWGTGVSIRAGGTGERADADSVLERLLDELGTANRRPFSRS